MEFENNGGNPPISVTGNIYATTYFEALSNVLLTGTHTDHYTTHVPFPTVDLNYFQTIAEANGTYYAGSKVFSAADPIPANPVGGVVYVGGSCSIYGTQNTQATLVIGGSLAIQKTGNTYPKITITKNDAMPALIVMGDTTFQSSGNGGAYFTVRGFIYSGRSFTFKPNHADFRLVGQLVARSNIEIDPEGYGTANIVYWAQNPIGVESYNS